MLDFMGIGAQKAATSWTYQNLARHPHVRFPAGKEVHFWDKPDGRTVPDWRALFERNPGLRIDRLRHRLNPRFVMRKQGEITPAYSFIPVADIRRIAGIYPALRLLFNVRNPIERAWSQARMRLTRVGTAGDAADESWLFDFFRSADCVKRTDYLTTLDNWWSVFGRDAVLVSFFDDVVADPATVLNRMAAHIGVEPFAPRVLAGAHMPVNEGRSAAMPPHVHAFLADQYRAPIAELGQRFGRDLTGWLAPA